MTGFYLAMNSFHLEDTYRDSAGHEAFEVLMIVLDWIANKVVCQQTP